jgi:ATP-dependent helicase STH1/SNF2
VKLLVENVDAKKEKDEARAEIRRLQALKENDMEAYAALVADTRNGRLKFLLNETDTYIATINKMIQDQRVEEETDEILAAVDEVGSLAADTTRNSSSSITGAAGLSSSDVNAIESEMARESNAKHGSGATNKMTQVTKDYYRSTHRAIEVVAQPTMLRGGDLKEYQLSGLQWMVSLYNNNLNGILADEMGLGKTIQTIALLAYLMEYKHNNGPFLIVVPLSTLSNWVNEFNKWAPDMLKVVYKGAPEDRKRIFKDDVEAGHLNVLLTTYEYIMKDKSSLRKLHWQYIIVDEGHRMKNAQSKFAQTLGTVYQSRHRILLTGTPLQNNLPELWALLNFLLPTIFSSVDTFDQWFNKPFTAFRTQGVQTGIASEDGNEVAVLSQEERMLIVHRLHEVLRPFMLRRVKDQVLDQLPEKVEKVLRCNLSGWQRKMYHSITMKGLGVKSDKDGGGGGLNNTIMQLRKVCNHPYLFVRDYAVDEDLVRSSGKFELLDRMLPKLKAAGHRVLLFSQMVELMNFLEQFFLLRGFQYLRLDGNTSSEEREKRMYQFNDPDSPYFIFLLSTRAGGLGLNLATADTVIIFDSDWNPMMDAQAQDRAHRIGQKNEVRVFRLLTTSPIEERILSRANDKRNLTGLVVEAGKFSSKTAGASAFQENKELMESMLNEWSTGGAGAFNSDAAGPDYEGSGAGGGTEGDDEDDLPDDEQINEMMASYAGEMELYQTMDRERYQRKAQHWATVNGVTTLNQAPPMPARLMGATEKPYWLTNECWPTKYSVLMSDMMNTAPQGPRKKGRKKKSELQGGAADGEGKRPDHSDDAADGDSEDGRDWDDQVSVSFSDQYIVAGKAMRKRKDVQYDDHMTDLQFSRFVEHQTDLEEAGEVSLLASSVSIGKTPKKGAIKTESDGMSSSLVHKELAKIVRDLQKIKRPDGSLLAELFLDKPPKAVYPDYYALIETPIALKDILARLKKAPGVSGGGYRFLEEVEMDFALMAHNARTFNMDSSPVFQDCEAVRREFFERCGVLRLKFDLPAPSTINMIPLPSIGFQIYDSSRSFRCDLTLHHHAVDQEGDGRDMDEVISNTPRKQQSTKRKSEVLSVSAKRAKLTMGQAEFLQPSAKIKFTAPSPYATHGTAPDSAVIGHSGSLSLNLKRKAFVGANVMSESPLQQSTADDSSSTSSNLVLSINMKSLKSQQGGK